MNNQEPARLSGHFPTTLWTQIIEVIQKGDAAVASLALSDFCERYRPAVYNFFRRRGCNHPDAEELTQEFFANRIIEKHDPNGGFLHMAQRSEHGKFRSFLSHVLWRFLQDKWKHERAARSGGGVSHVPLEAIEQATEGADAESFKRFGSEFDRIFALEIIQKAGQRSRHSRHLLAHLKGEISQAEAARELGLSENTFKQAYHRFRERLAHDLWEEVSSLAGPDQQEVKAEIRYLMSLFAEQGA